MTTQNVEAQKEIQNEEVKPVEAKPDEQILKTQTLKFNKMDIDAIPPKEKLRADQEWKFGKNGWRKCKIQSEEQKQQKAEKMRELGKKSQEKTKVYKQEIQKKEEELKQVKQVQENDIKSLITEMQQLNSNIKNKFKEQEAKEEKKNDSKIQSVHQIIQEQQPQTVKKVCKNPLLQKYNQ